MYESLIQKSMNRNVGAIAGTLMPTSGDTCCTVETGKFSNTYDGYTATYCCFKRSGTCLSWWHWDKPVNVTKFNMLSLHYNIDSEIYLIWGYVNGSWVELWSGVWNPTHAYWDSKAVSCNNCTGILIGQRHVSQPSRPCILEVSVDYEEIVEGKASIISTGEPDNFTPNVEFRVRPTITNVGAGDTLFVILTNTDTGDVFKPDPPEVYVSSGKNWVPSIYVTLDQTYDFNGLLGAGHVE